MTTYTPARASFPAPRRDRYDGADEAQFRSQLERTFAETVAYVERLIGDGETVTPHVLATEVGLGVNHTMSGAVSGYTLRATGATTAAWAQLTFADLGGQIADGQVPQSAVTQHQAALSIAETQIPNGALLARVADAETVTGLWTFDRDPNAPFAVAAGSAVVPNLDADLLDGQHASAFATAAHTHPETDIVDGSLLARVADNETISGLYTFSNASGLLTNVIGERTAAAGVTIDGLLIRDAGIPEAAVTAHEAALTILESQITDGSILARLAASESVTGDWTFSGSFARVQRSGGDSLFIADGINNNNATIMSDIDTGGTGYAHLLVRRQGNFQWSIGVDGNQDSTLRISGSGVATPASGEEAATINTSREWTFPNEVKANGGLQGNAEGISIGVDAAGFRRLALVKQSGVQPEIRYLNSVPLNIRRVTSGTLLVPSASDKPLIVETDGAVTMGGVKVGPTATIVVDGTDGSIAAGSNGIFEALGNLNITSRGNVQVTIDNDNNATTNAFAVAGSLGTLLSIDDNGTTLFQPNGTLRAELNATRFRVVDQIRVGTDTSVSGSKGVYVLDSATTQMLIGEDGSNFGGFRWDTSNDRLECIVNDGGTLVEVAGFDENGISFEVDTIVNGALDVGSFAGGSASNSNSGTQNAWDVGENIFITWQGDTTGNLTVNGIAGGRDGRVLIVRIGPGAAGVFTLTFNHENVSASTNDRLILGTGASPITLSTAGDCVMFVYDGAVDNRWILVNVEP